MAADYYTIEITFTDPNEHSAKIHRIKNVIGAKLRDFRASVWHEGFFWPVNGSTMEGYLIGPQMIRYIYFVKQDKYHAE